jgi:hypothetical protein
LRYLFTKDRSQHYNGQIKKVYKNNFFSEEKDFLLFLIIFPDVLSSWNMGEQTTYTVLCEGYFSVVERMKNMSYNVRIMRSFGIAKICVEETASL